MTSYNPPSTNGKTSKEELERLVQMFTERVSIMHQLLDQLFAEAEALGRAQALGDTLEKLRTAGSKLGATQ